MSAQKTLQERITNREAKIGVVGLGYVGLPLAMAFAQAGFPVTGLEREAQKVESLKRGESYLKHISSGTLGPLVRSGKLTATDDYSVVAELDCILICVQTPLTSAREPDLTHIIEAGHSLRPHVRPGHLFVLESTTYPGTTDEVLRPLLEREGLMAGKEFNLAFSPERQDPGNEQHSAKTIPKVVGGHTPGCLEMALSLYATAMDQVVPVSGTRVAELSKLLENIFRCVNIALVNELKVLCDRMNLDVWEVIQAASTKPFGFMAFSPGPGLGGHCIPVDPFYLTWKARQFDVQTKLIELAGEVNSAMPDYVVQRTMESLNDHRKALNGSRVLVIGAAYKKDIDDVRGSPSLRIIALLNRKGALVDYHDPFVEKLEPSPGFELTLNSVSLEPERLRSYDAVLIVTDHSCIDYANLVQQASLVIDTRNATQKVKRGREKIVRA